jgi:hypothetical protein
MSERIERRETILQYGSMLAMFPEIDWTPCSMDAWILSTETDHDGRTTDAAGGTIIFVKLPV